MVGASFRDRFCRVTHCRDPVPQVPSNHLIFDCQLKHDESEICHARLASEGFVFIGVHRGASSPRVQSGAVRGGRPEAVTAGTRDVRFASHGNRSSRNAVDNRQGALALQPGLLAHCAFQCSKKLCREEGRTGARGHEVACATSMSTHTQTRPPTNQPTRQTAHATHCPVWRAQLRLFFLVGSARKRTCVGR